VANFLLWLPAGARAMLPVRIELLSPPAEGAGGPPKT
jgi:hypothetical protein